MATYKDTREVTTKEGRGGRVDIKRDSLGQESIRVTRGGLTTNEGPSTGNRKADDGIAKGAITRRSRS